MKKLGLIIFLITVFFYGLAYAVDITFEWDSNTEPDMSGYRIYQSSVSGQYVTGEGNEIATIPHIAGPTHTYTLLNIPQGLWYWVLTAFDTGGMESDVSNELTQQVGPPLPDTPPDFPKNMALISVNFIRFTIQGLPVALQGTAPESKNAVLTLNSIPLGTTVINLVLTVFDSDFADEGRLLINGQGSIVLFGADGVEANDAISKTLAPITTNISLYHLGDNTLTFWHDNTQGYIIESIAVEFN